MPFNGSGIFVRTHNWTTDRNGGVKIRADRHDQEDDGFATGLSNCITKDGQTTITAAIPFNNQRLTSLGSPVSDTDAANKKYVDDTVAALNLVGAVCAFARNSAPTGWLKANGAVVSRTTYADLFAVIGTTFNTGGEAGTDFRLPDLRGEFVRGWADDRTVDTGRAFGSTQTDEFKAHTHLNGSVDGAGVKVNASTVNGGAGSIIGFAAGGVGNFTTGSTGSTETRPRNVALLYCIKY